MRSGYGRVHWHSTCSEWMGYNMDLVTDTTAVELQSLPPHSLLPFLSSLPLMRNTEASRQVQSLPPPPFLFYLATFLKSLRHGGRYTSPEMRWFYWFNETMNPYREMSLTKLYWLNCHCFPLSSNSSTDFTRIALIFRIEGISNCQG
jgi:hypothetical protein